MERDPEIVHRLDQNAAEFNSKKDEFTEKFGFEHHCTCDTDYTEGRTTEVALCFVELASDALKACALMKAYIDKLEANIGNDESRA